MMLYHFYDFDDCHKSQRSSGQTCFPKQRSILSVLRANSELHLNSLWVKLSTLLHPRPNLARLLLHAQKVVVHLVGGDQ